MTYKTYRNELLTQLNSLAAFRVWCEEERDIALLSVEIHRLKTKIQALDDMHAPNLNKHVKFIESTTESRIKYL